MGFVDRREVSGSDEEAVRAGDGAQDRRIEGPGDEGRTLDAVPRLVAERREDHACDQAQEEPERQVQLVLRADR